MQNDLQHHQDDDRIRDTQTRGERPRFGTRKSCLQKVCAHASRAQAEKSNRNREKGEVIEEHHGEQARER